MNQELDINFHGRDWILMKAYLEKMQKDKIGLLIGADSQSQSDKIRGALQLISQLLALEAAAQSRAAQ
jgi:hypothetical protein